MWEDQRCSGLKVRCVSEGLVDLWKDYVSGGKERKRLLESRYGRSVLTLTLESLLSEGWTAVNTKPCPNCFAKIEVKLLLEGEILKQTCF